MLCSVCSISKHITEKTHLDHLNVFVICFNVTLIWFTTQSVCSRSFNLLTLLSNQDLCHSAQYLNLYLSTFIKEITVNFRSKLKIPILVSALNYIYIQKTSQRFYFNDSCDWRIWIWMNILQRHSVRDICVKMKTTPLFWPVGN